MDLVTSFQVFPLAFDEYRESCNQAIRATEEARAVSEILRSLGGSVVEWDESEGRDLSAVDARLRKWSRSTHGRCSMLLWFGHGGSNQVDAWLAVPGAPGRDSDHLFNPPTFARHVIQHFQERGDGPDWTLILIEACGAQRFVELMLSELARERVNRGIVLIASGADQGRGYLASFRNALAGALDTYTDNDREIGLRDLASRIEDRLSPGGVYPLGLAHTRPLKRTARLSEPVTAPMDVYTRLLGLVDELSEHERTHFAVKGMGSALGEPAWNFVGRQRERAAIADWLNGRDRGLLIVTGRAGSGKSAILGNVLLHSRPQIGEILIRAGFLPGWDGRIRPPEFDLSLHLTGATLDDVAARIAHAAAVPVPPTGASGEERIAALLEVLRGRDLTLLADALDEAQEPLVLASLFRRLGALPGIRVVLGTRPSSREEPDRPAETDRELLSALGADRLPHVAVQWVRRDPVALAEFIRRRLQPLRERIGTGFEGAVERVVALVTAGEREFLYAELAAREILADPGLLAIERAAELAALLDGDHRSLFGAAVRRLSRELPYARQVLGALAFAQGRGLPRTDRIWAAAASALGEEEVGDRELSEVVKAAAPYIMLDAEEDQSVHRLAHRTFQEYFLGEDHGGEGRRRVAEALLALADGDDEGVPLNPYLARHLSGHIRASGPDAWGLLDRSPGVLDRLDPRAVAADAMNSGISLDRLPANVIGTMTTAHLAERAGPQDRTGLRRLGVVRARGSAAGASVEASAGKAWDVSWAHLRTQPPHLTLAGHRGPVRAVTVFRGTGGAPLLATGGDDRTVRVWDPATGHLVFPPLTGHADSVLTVTAVRGPGDMPLLVTTSGEGGRGSIRVWDATTGVPFRADPPGLTTADVYVSAIAFTGGDGAPRVALGTLQGPIHLFDPVEGRSAGEPLRGHSHSVTGMALLPSESGGSLLASASVDHTVRIWDLSTGRQARPPLSGHGSPITAITAAEAADGSPRLITAGKDGVVRLWDLSSGKGHPIDIGAKVGADLVLTSLRSEDGTSLLVIGTDDGSIQLWDLDRGEWAAQPLTRHEGRVITVQAFLSSTGTTLIVSGGDDGKAKIWSPGANPSAATSENRICSGTIGHTAGNRDQHLPVPEPVRSMAGLTASQGSRLLAVCGGGRVRIWDPERGTVVPARLPEPPGMWDVMTSYRSVGGSSRLVAAARDGGGEVVAYDPVSGESEVLFPAYSPPQQGSLLPSPPRRERLTAMTSFVGRDGAVRVVTAWGSATICVWKATRATFTAAVRVAGWGEVQALGAAVAPDGTEVVAAAVRNPEIGLWSLDTGEPWGDPLIGHEEWVQGLTFYRGRDGSVLLASGDEDGALRIWDPWRRVLLHTILLGLPCRALCVCGEELAVGTDEGFLMLRLTGGLAVTGAVNGS